MKTMRTALILILASMTTTLVSQNLDVDGKAKITSMDTVIDVSTNIVRQSDGTLALRQYKIGDLAHGGIVFYVDETGEHGLVVDTVDLSLGIRWYAGTNGDTGATGDGLYAGEMNTSVIISSHVAIGDDGADYAARLCLEHTRAEYGDWYLPSAEELVLMYNNLHLAGLGGFANAFYWSSTEQSNATALIHGFGTGTTNFSLKSANRVVRAVRSF